MILSLRRHSPAGTYPSPYPVLTTSWISTDHEAACETTGTPSTLATTISIHKALDRMILYAHI
jgi:hypothetical protein